MKDETKDSLIDLMNECSRAEMKRKKFGLKPPKEALGSVSMRLRGILKREGVELPPATEES